MKELYLIPKQGYERILTSLNTTGIKVKDKAKSGSKGEWKTSIPPTLQKSSPSRVPLRVLKTVENKEIRNPSLYDILPMTFKGDEISRAKIMLKYLEKTGNVSWDSNGDLYAPVNDGNIIDIIKDFNSQTTQFTNREISLYRYIITATDLPIWMIENDEIKKLILPKNKQTSTGKKKKIPVPNSTKRINRKAFYRINKKILNRSWTSY